MLALDDGQKAYRVRHSKVMAERLSELAELIAAAQEAYLAAGELFKRAAKIHLSAEQLAKYLDKVYPQTVTQKKNNEEPQRWAHIKEALDTFRDLQDPKVRGTLWAAYNAITRFEDYKQQRENEEPEERLNRIWFEAGADVKLKAYQALDAIARAS